MRKILTVSTVFVGLGIVLLAVALAAVNHTSHRSSPGSFSVACPLAFAARDDPIVMPGMGGMSHLHAFFGNTSTSANSTRDAMLAATTTCEDPRDTSAVWTPVALMDGQVVVPPREKTYYFRASGHVGTVPADLRAIAGDPHATAPGPLAVTWDCGIDTPRADHPYDCRPYTDSGGRVDGIIARIDFPICWDGSIDAPDHRSNLVYADRGRCPPDHPHEIPRISVRVHFGIWDPCAGAMPCGPDEASAANVAMTLSSGPYYTMHADFWNTWQQDALDALVDRCVRGREACGGIAGDG